MGVSVLDIQRDILLDVIRRSAKGDWKVLIVDETSRKLLFNVTKEDDILNQNVTNIEQIEQKRPANPETDAVYFLSPQSHVVECLCSDIEKRRYHTFSLLWTSLLDPRSRNRIDSTPGAQDQIVGLQVLTIDFYPRESHVITFRDPWSFPIFFHPACNSLIKQHMQDIAQKLVSVCVTLGEYPTIRYFKPPEPTHEASVLGAHLARFVQDELDNYAQYHSNFPPPTNRPRGALFITDRSMDLFAPLVHEFTYQAMAHDLLPVKDGDKVTYKTTLHAGEPNEEEKDMEISEADKIWVENRHSHMKDTIERLMGDFNKFIQENPHFAASNDGATSLNAIKDMLAGLPEFQELKDAYSLHLSMAQDCMNIFQNRKLPDLASVEQSLATGLDEDYRRPKNLGDQVVRSLDEDSVVPGDRLRLVMLYLLYRDGLLPADVSKLLAHAQLPPQDQAVIANLELLGGRVQKPLKDTRPAPPLLFGKKQAMANSGDGYALSRYDPALKSVLDEHVKGTLDQAIFPYTKPQLDVPPDGMSGVNSVAQTSLRSAKPTWAKTRLNSVEPRQRIIVFMAGGATYSESRACYEVSQATSRDVFLTTSHMITPRLYLRQLGDLTTDRRRLDIPADRPRPKPPQHLFEPNPQQQKPQPPTPGGPTPPSKSPVAPTTAMGAMKISPNRRGQTPNEAGRPGSRPHHPGPPEPGAPSGPHRLEKRDKDDKKKKHHFFSSKK